MRAKRIVCAGVTVLLLCNFLTSCGKPPEGHLGLADFHVYQNGKVVLEIGEDKDFIGMYISDPPEERIEYEIYHPSYYGYADATVSTSRGIMLGDSAEDVIEAYSGIKLRLLCQDWAHAGGGEEGNSLEEFLAEHREHDNCKFYIYERKVNNKFVYPGDARYDNFFELAKEAEEPGHYLICVLRFCFDKGVLTRMKIEEESY